MKAVPGRQDWVSDLRGNKDLIIIVGNLKGLFLIAAILMGAMIIPALLFRNLSDAAGFFLAMACSLAIAAAIHLTTPPIVTLELKHAIIVAAMAYLFIPALSAIPLIVSTDLAPLDAFFEAISGWTGSGFSMIPAPERISPTMQLWRSAMQWVGGAGVILLMVTVLIRPGTSTYVLYQSEARKEKIRPSIRSILRTIWKLYLLLTVMAFLLLLLAGMPLWDSINTAMTAISTGGFSLYADSIGHYDSLAIEVALLPIMIAGALPFAAVYAVYMRHFHILAQDVQVRTFAVLLLAGSAILLAQNFLYGYPGVFSAARHSVFQFVSAITCTGLQSTELSGWSPTALLILSIAMIVGGCAGSTAGGIKIAREIFLVNQVKLWLIKTLLSGKAVIVMRLGDHKVVEQAMTAELNEASLISFLWIVSVVASIMLLSDILGTDVSLSKIIFEVCSAQGNVGLTTGILTPAISPLAKVIFMVDMWLGRLEIVPVILLVRAVLKGFRRY